MLNEQQTTGMLSFAGLSPTIRGPYLQDVMARKDLGGFNEGEPRPLLLLGVRVVLLWPSAAVLDNGKHQLLVQDVQAVLGAAAAAAHGWCSSAN
jgi:hypothetical protein